MKKIKLLLRCFLPVTLILLAFGCRKIDQKPVSPPVAATQPDALQRIRQALARYPVRLTAGADTVTAGLKLRRPVLKLPIGLERFVKVDEFYAFDGEPGACWQGLSVDRAGNLYPVATGSIAKLSPGGELLNGVTKPYFATGSTFALFGTIDEKANKIYTASDFAVNSAPFSEGSVLQPAYTGFYITSGIITGRGPLRGNLLVVEYSSDLIAGIRRIAPDGTVSWLSTGPFTFPYSMASAPNGTLYTVDIGTTPAKLFKTTPSGKTSLFATAPAEDFANIGITVDKFGFIYWTRNEGIAVYSPAGKHVFMLPPPDGGFSNPFGMQFDRSGKRLYVVENSRCRQIYKYTLRLPCWPADEKI